MKPKYDTFVRTTFVVPQDNRIYYIDVPLTICLAYKNTHKINSLTHVVGMRVDDG